jgi:hypothetical protein
MSAGSLLCNENIAMVFSTGRTILRAMKSGTLSRCVATLLLAGFSLSLHAEVRDNPYQIIIDRNPFGLHPIPPPPAPVTNAVVEEKPPTDIKITGITTLLGPAKVFLQVKDDKTKKDTFVTFTEGDTEVKEGIQLVAVDTQTGSVRVRSGDQELTLDFDKNGVKPTGGATASAMPVPPPPGGGVVPLNTPAPLNNFNNPSSRAIVSGGNGGMPTAAVAPNANPAFPGAVNNMPVRSMRADNVIVSGNGVSGANNPTPQPTTTAPQLSREEVMARIEAQRQILLQKEQQGAAPAGMSRILPPTPYSPPGTTVPAPPAPR